MTENSEQKNKLDKSKLKQTFVRSFAFGFGVMLALIAFYSVYSWYSSRPKAWDSRAITCDVDKIMTEGDDNTYVISYSIQNNTKYDYTISDNTDFVLAVKLKAQKSITPNLKGSEELRIDTPIFVPAKQRAVVDIHLKYPSKIKCVNYNNRDERKKYFEAVKKEISGEYPNFEGFMVYDKENKYQIIFPSGW